MAFRVAHEVAGAAVRAAEARGVELADLTDEELGGLHRALAADVGAARAALTVAGSVASRSARGGTAPAAVARQLVELRERAAALGAPSARRPRPAPVIRPGAPARPPRSHAAGQGVRC